MYRRNRTGPRTVPWGTPETIQVPSLMMLLPEQPSETCRTLRYEKVLPVPAAHIGKPFSLGMPFHVTSLIIVLGFNKLDENKVENCMRLCFTKMHYRKHTKSTGVITFIMSE